MKNKSDSDTEYELQKLHINSIVSTIKSTGGTVMGGVADGSRWKKGDMDINSNLIEPIQRMLREKVVGNDHLQGMVFHHCYLTGNDMDYIMNMTDWVDYNFKIIDFSDNLGINDLGIFYALRGNCSHEDGVKYKGFLGRDRLHVEKLNLSNCNISDEGAGLIAEALYDGKLASTKLINLGGNNITKSGFQKMKDIIGNVKQELFIITETNYDTGKAIFKDTDSKFYEMSIKSDGKESAFEFANGITGISGVSSGDTCPAPVKDQILGCIKGAIPATAGAWVGCGGTTVAYPVCIANAAIIGCGVGVIGVGLSPCVDNTYNNIETFLGGNRDHDKGDFSFSATGGTEIQGSYIDNSRGPMGSNIDLSQHDF